MDDRFPLLYQILCIVLTALFVWSFVISRDPRPWRRLYQSQFCKAEDFSVNRNKAIDEKLRYYGIVISMIFLVADVGFFLWGASHQDRRKWDSLTVKERQKMEEVEKIRDKNEFMLRK